MMKKHCLFMLAVFGALSLGAAPAARIMSLEYFYAKDGTITGRSVNGRMLHYQYDKLGQLLAVVDDKGQAVEKYVYDRAGNILEKTVNGVTTVNTYDKANQLVTSATDGRVTHYRYDAAGRLVEEGGKSYRYGYLDKVLEVSENNNPLATFDYHLNGQIAAATRNGATETFTWDGLALIHRGSESYLNEPYITGGNPLLSSKGNVLFNDMLGSTLGVKNNNTLNTTAMTAFGESADSSVFFTGKPKVDELGYAFLFRNYRAEQGKWTSQDPIALTLHISKSTTEASIALLLGYPDGWNNLAYGNNMVLNGVDSQGTVWVLVSDSGAPDNIDNVRQISRTTAIDGIRWTDYVYRAIYTLADLLSTETADTWIRTFVYDCELTIGTISYWRADRHGAEPEETSRNVTVDHYNYTRTIVYRWEE